MVEYSVIDRGYYRKPLKVKFLAGFFIMLAFGVGLWAYGPVIWYQGLIAPQIGNRTYVSPLPNSVMVLGVNSDGNYYDPNSWFSREIEPKTKVILPQIGEYSITIPSLRIKNAKVIVGANDLSKSLIHYQGTAEPGTLGSGVIFGHSVLPQFYNPKNYKAIFSTLHTIAKGESVIVEYDKVLYLYQVVDKYEINADDLYVLEQDLSEETLKLITCTPPGTYAKRLVVESKLVPYEGLEEIYEKEVVPRP
jgi:LPXTG-site transpeptidase (sortase) family protein